MKSRPTIIGVNVPWFGGGYGHDLGRNSSYPDWPVCFDSRRVSELFQQLKTLGIGHVRYWLFEDGEGLICNNEGCVIGLDALFVNNLLALIDLAREHEIQIYWVLLDANSVLRRPDMVTRQILRSTYHADSFWRSAIAVILGEISKVAWAIDLCNEPEAVVAGTLGNGIGLGFDWVDVAPSLNFLADSIRITDPRIALAVGSGFQNHRCHLIGNYHQLRLDAFDFHFHSHDKPIAPAESISQKHPVILGELGWPIPLEWPEDRSTWLRGQESLTRRLYEAVSQRMTAVFLWASDYLGCMDCHNLIYQHEIGSALHAVRHLQQRGLADISSSHCLTLMEMCQRRDAGF
jgi:hypothetical protein